MSDVALLRAILRAMHGMRAGAAMAPLTRGAGVIFTLHHVRPEPPPAFSPNRILAITPTFLEQMIEHVLGAGYDVIRLDDIPRRLAEPASTRRFACFTFDDGYRDNHDHALPVFERYGLPLAIYVTSEFADGTGDLWWLALEEAIRRLDTVDIEMPRAPHRLPARTLAEKVATFDAIYWHLRSLPEDQTRAQTAALCRRAGYDPRGLSRELAMGWPELRALSSHPLVTVGAHTVGHWALAKLPLEDARRQLMQSMARLEAETGQPCRHFSFPYGDETSAGAREFELARSAGLRTAVTTRKGLIHAHHAQEITALPRLSLNGDYQDIRHLEVLLTGAPFALLDMASRMRQTAARVLKGRSAAST